MAEPQKHVWITGGGGAIGAALALKYAKADYRVTITGRSAQSLKIVAARHANIQIHAGDVTDATTMKKVLEELGLVDLAILNAGTYAPGPTSKTSLADFRISMEVNYFGVLNCLIPILEKMRATEQGHIAIVGSLAGYCGLPNASGYGASKAAVVSLCESLRAELQDTKIKLQLVSPGFVKSQLTAKNDFEMPDLLTPEEAATYIYDGLQQDQFEVWFPPKFGRKMKLLQLLPYKQYFSLIRKFVMQ